MSRKLNLVQTNFTAGVWSHLLYGHTDLAKYKNAIKEGLNVFCLPYGPIIRRPGFAHINEVGDSTKKVRLIRFQLNQTDSYILECGHQYIRFYKNGGLLSSGGSPYSVGISYTETEWPDVSFVQFGKVLYFFHGSYAPVQLERISDTNWVVSVLLFFPPATIEDGEKPISSLTPAATSGDDIVFGASSATFIEADVGRQLHNLSGAGKAVIITFTSSTVVRCDIIEAFPNTNPITSQNWKIDLSPTSSVTPNSAREGVIGNYTSSIDRGWINNAARIMVGMYIVINGGVSQIRNITSSTVCKAENQKGMASVAASSAWSLEIPAWSVTFGFPKVCALHQQRLWAAHTTKNPERIWASQTGIFDSMGIGEQDDDGLDFDITSNEISSVSWMASVRGQLVVGTNTCEMTIDAGTTTGAVTPSNINQQIREYNGSLVQRPVSLNDEVIYIQKSKRKLMSFRYDFQIDNYRSTDLLFYAAHLVSESTIKEVCYASSPNNQLFAVLDNGDLLCCTYIPAQEVIAWTLIQTEGSFESVNTISTGINDEVWVVVNRTINGVSKRYVERLDTSQGDGILDGMMDSYLTYYNPKVVTEITKANPGVVTSTAHGLNNGDFIKLKDVGGMVELLEEEGISQTFKVANKTADTFELIDLQDNNVNTTSFTTYTSGGEVHKLVSTVTGLGYLEGKTVSVKVDGGVHEDCVVTGGSISLNNKAFAVVVGLPYSHRIVTLPKEFDAGEGSQQTQPIRWSRPVLRFYKSCLPTLNGEIPAIRDAQQPMDTVTDLFTGDIEYGSLVWQNGFSSSLVIESNKPLPMTLLGIFGSAVAGSR